MTKKIVLIFIIAFPSLSREWEPHFNFKISNKASMHIQSQLGLESYFNSHKQKPTLLIQPSTHSFHRPLSLEKQISFWTKIYSYYDSHQVVFYDYQDPRVIYFVLNLPKKAGEISAPYYKNLVKKKYQEIERILDNKIFSEDSKRIDQILKRYKIEKNNELKKRIKTQSGLRSQFALGLKNSGRYIADMKKVLKAHELPEELIALVFVESLYFLNATSHAGASGLWGIMKETALRTGIYVNNFTDERLDPILSTWAAAQFLKKAKEGLGEWPLAITAYNYGYPGMLRAVSNLQTNNIEEIIARHESPIFGYASKNYYAEFIAALDVYNQREYLFPEIKSETPWRYEIVKVTNPLEVGDLISAQAISKEELIKLNPSISKRTLSNKEVIPPSYFLRVPYGATKDFYAKLKRISPAKRKAAETKISTKYKSNGREKLSIIAKKHGISLDFLSKKLSVSATYCPKGTINIRSQAYLFSSLKNMTFVKEKE
jgi:membrane-bound lytic murein transglycosylase D